MNLLKAVLMAKYGYTRAEVNKIVDGADKITSIENLYDIALIELSKEKNENCAKDKIDMEFLILEMFQ